MSDTLTQLISRTQILLGDDGTIFTTALLTGSIRQALTEFNGRLPQVAAELITGVNDQYEYELSDVDAQARHIFDVLQQGDNADELDISIGFDQYIEDERVFFRLRSPVTTSDTLIVRFTKNHTINGLDSQTDSTLLARHDQIIVDGAAYFAILTRATARVETINLSKDQSDNYREIMTHFRAAFNLGLNEANRRESPVGEPDNRRWEV